MKFNALLAKIILSLGLGCFAGIATAQAADESSNADYPKFEVSYSAAKFSIDTVDNSNSMSRQMNGFVLGYRFTKAWVTEYSHYSYSNSDSMTPSDNYSKVYGQYKMDNYKLTIDIVSIGKRFISDSNLFLGLNLGLGNLSASDTEGYEKSRFKLSKSVNETILSP